MFPVCTLNGDFYLRGLFFFLLFTVFLFCENLFCFTRTNKQERASASRDATADTHSFPFPRTDRRRSRATFLLRRENNATPSLIHSRSSTPRHPALHSPGVRDERLKGKKTTGGGKWNGPSPLSSRGEQHEEERMGMGMGMGGSLCVCV